MEFVTKLAVKGLGAGVGRSMKTGGGELAGPILTNKKNKM